MPDVLEPAIQPFNSESGRIAGLRSAELRHKQAKELETLRTILSEKPASEIISEVKPVNQEVTRQIDLSNEQLERTRAILNDDESCWCEHCERGGVNDKERAGLLRELRGLMEHLCRLHNIPDVCRARQTPVRSAGVSLPQPRIPQAVVVAPSTEQPK